MQEPTIASLLLAFCHRQIDGKMGSIFSNTRRFPANSDDVRFACFQVAHQVTVMVFAMGMRHEHIDICPKKLIAFIAKHFHRGGIHRLNDPLLIDGNDGIVDGIVNCF